MILKRRARVELADTFMCMDGVDALKLLRATRASLHERAEGLLGSCVFVEESLVFSISLFRALAHVFVLSICLQVDLLDI